MYTRPNEIHRIYTEICDIIAQCHSKNQDNYLQELELELEPLLLLLVIVIFFVKQKRNNNNNKFLFN